MAQITTSRLTVRYPARAEHFAKVTSVQAVPDQIQDILKKQPKKTFATLVADINEEGAPAAIFWSLNSYNNQVCLPHDIHNVC